MYLFPSASSLMILLVFDSLSNNLFIRLSQLSLITLSSCTVTSFSAITSSILFSFLSLYSFHLIDSFFISYMLCFIMLLNSTLSNFAIFLILFISFTLNFGTIALYPSNFSNICSLFCLMLSASSLTHLPN